MYQTTNKKGGWLGVRVKCPVFLPILNQIWRFSTDLHKSPKISNFHENPSSGNSATPRGQTDRRIDGHMKKLIVDFRDYSNARNKERS